MSGTSAVRWHVRHGMLACVSACLALRHGTVACVSACLAPGPRDAGMRGNRSLPCPEAWHGCLRASLPLPMANGRRHARQPAHCRQGPRPRNYNIYIYIFMRAGTWDLVGSGTWLPAACLCPWPMAARPLSPNAQAPKAQGQGQGIIIDRGI